MSPNISGFVAEPHSPSLQDLEQIQGQIRDNQFVPALAALARLIARDMRNAQLWLLTGLAYTRMASWKPAISALETALQLDPQEIQAKYLLALALFSVGRVSEACDLIDKVARKGSVGPHWMMRAYIHAHTSRDPMVALAVARDWGKRFADPLTRQARPLVVRDREPRKRLKVGYVSADLREHSVAFFIEPMLAHHNPERVEVHIYSNGPVDDITVQLQSLVAHWRDVQALTDEELHAQIREDGIDVLVDLSGYTNGHRLGVFARRAAPVQVTWLGYKLTLGMKAMDYRLFDATAPRVQQFYSEKLFPLKCPTSYTPPAYAPICEEPPASRNGYVTFVSLNNSAKITAEVLELWAEILGKVENSQLLVYVKEENLDAAQSHMMPRVQSAGLPLNRVLVIAHQPLSNFMETGFIADIVLDTFPICGGTTTLHSIWMGMPVVAMLGKRDVENSSAKAIWGLGMGGRIAKTKQEYVRHAIGLANDVAFLRQCRATYRQGLIDSSLMNYRARVHEVEDAYQQMWMEYLKKNN